MAKPQAKAADQTETQPALVIEDSKPEPAEAPKPQKVTELPSGVKIEDF